MLNFMPNFISKILGAELYSIFKVAELEHEHEHECGDLVFYTQFCVTKIKHKNYLCTKQT